MYQDTQDFFRQLPFNSKDDLIVPMKIDGFNVHVPSSFKNATKELQDHVTGGCGPGGFGDRLVPDFLFGCCVTLACKVHDWTFNVWNDAESFTVANKLFRRNMCAIIDQSSGKKWLKGIRKGLALVYALGVSGKLGKRSYYDNHLKYLI